MMQYGSAGIGSGSHTCGILIDMALGVTVTHVPYRGAGPAMQDLIAGRLDFIPEQISTATPQIKGGTVKAIVTWDATRARPGGRPAAPEVRLERPRLRRLGRLLVPQGHAEGDRGRSPRRPATRSTRRR